MKTPGENEVEERNGRRRKKMRSSGRCRTDFSSGGACSPLPEDKLSSREAECTRNRGYQQSEGLRQCTQVKLETKNKKRLNSAKSSQLFRFNRAAII
jgi:hypothetical protein